MLTAKELVEFEEEVGARFDAGEIPGPIHLCSESQAEPLIEIFSDIEPTAWVLSNWRSHWHALLKGVPRELVMSEIVAGRSMMLHFPEHRFMTSAIVGGMLPIACGLAAGGERVWCFVGDMCASTGAFSDAVKFAHGHALQLRFVMEDNGLSTNTPTAKAWGESNRYLMGGHRHYFYNRTTNHYGTKSFVSF